MTVDVVGTEWNGDWLFKFPGHAIKTKNQAIYEWLCEHSRVTALLPGLWAFDNVNLEELMQKIELVEGA
jgi:hypothetical protein